MYRVQKRALSCLLMFALILALFTGINGKGKVVQAAVSANFTQTHASATMGAANTVYGTVASGSAASLAVSNHGYMVMNSASNGSAQEASFWSDMTLHSPASNMVSLKLVLSSKTSIAGSSQKVYLYNFDTSAYDLVRTTAVGTTDVEDVYLLEDAAALLKYISPSNVLRMKVAVTNPSAFAASFDYVNAIYVYRPQVGNRVVSSYNVENATLEYGSIAANDAAFLRDRDASYFSVASSANKVAWNSTLSLNQTRSELKTLMVTYSGKYSANCNDTYLDLWNYQSGNWDVIYQFTSGTSIRTVEWVTSDTAYINKYVSESGDIKLRVYNSSTAAFTRDSDYLNVTVYYDTGGSVKSYSADTLTMEYGTATGGDLGSASTCNNVSLSCASDTGNKLAWQMSATVDVDKYYIKALTVMSKVKTGASTNNLYLSLYNYATGSFEVFRTQTSSTSGEYLIFTLNIHSDIRDHISDTGEIRARLYNSASGSFTRDTDALTFCVEYGTVGTFYFAQVTDIHTPSTGSNPNFLSAINDINNDTKPAFVVDTGDFTSHGVPAQFDQYTADRSRIHFPVYTAPGNHDVRWWNSNGKNDFKDRYGSLYQSFNYGGLHFVKLDSTVVLENDLAFNKKQLEWLASDLSAVGTQMPVILFAHHPGRETSVQDGDDITAQDALLQVIKNYNVVAYFSGHAHTWHSQYVNGILWLDNNDLLQQLEYTYVKVTPYKLYVYKRDSSGHTSTLWETALMKNQRRAGMTVTSASAQSNGNVDVSVNIDRSPGVIASVEARVDKYGSWTALTQNGSTWSGTINISGYTPSVPYGRHFAVVKLTDGDGKVWNAYKDYDWSGGPASTKWVFQTGDFIQAPPAYFNGVVYAGSEDGKIYAVNDSDGSLKWSYTTGDQVISGPAVHQGSPNLVIAGSHDKKLYALNADTGALVWSYTTGGSVLSNPLVDNGTVYFGSGDKYVYALNAADGALKWKYPAGGLMRQKPIVYNGKLYAFIRDTYLWYAIHTSDGSLYWRGNANTDESLWVVGDISPVMTGGNKLWCVDAQNTRAGYLNPSTGNLDWYSTGVTDAGSRGPATDGTRVFYATSSGTVIQAVQVSDNSTAWTKDLKYNASDIQPKSVNSRLIYDGGILYHIADRGRITGLDPANGNIKFIYDAVGYPERVFWSSAEVYNKTVYIGGLDGKLYAVRYTGN